MEPVVFDSDDVAATEDFLVRAYTKLHIGTSTDNFHAHISRGQLGTVTLDRLDIGFDMRYDVDQLGKICVCTVESGALEDHTTDGWTDDFGPGEIVSLAPPDRPYRGKVSNASYTITMFDTALLNRVATEASGNETVRLRGYRPVSAAAANQLRATIEYLGSRVRTDPVIGQWPLIVSTASQLLAASVLNAFDNTAVGDDTRRHERDAHPATLRRAIAFIESHPGDDIGAADIAAAAGVTVRAVQLAFRKHLGITPMAYVRQVRLCEAHKELRAADPATGSVTAVAAKWGFHHPGRFATQYRITYGVAPSQTLRE